MNAILWIRNPYPFRYDEYDLLQEALRLTFENTTLVYIREWPANTVFAPVDYVCIDNTNITTCKQIASTLKTIHLQYALLDKKYRGRLSDYCQGLEIAIQGPNDSKPEWAKEGK